MGIPLLLHLSIHVFLAVLSGFIVWLVWKKPIASFLSALISGAAVDFDHLIDYFIAFGWNFNLVYFIKGFEFLKTGKMYTLFHGWEYAIVFILAVFVFKNKTIKTIFFALSLGLFVHLCSDVVIDKVPIKSYFMVYKIKNNFDLEKLVTPEHWEKHIRLKKKFGF